MVRTVIVADTSAPSGPLKPHPQGGLEKVTLIVGQIWEDPAATVTDSFDSDAALVSRPKDAVAYYSFDDTQEPSKDTSEGGQFPGDLLMVPVGALMDCPVVVCISQQLVQTLGWKLVLSTLVMLGLRLPGSRSYMLPIGELFGGQANDHQIIIVVRQASAFTIVLAARVFRVLAFTWLPVTTLVGITSLR